jgi:hypothetical protein
MAITQGIRMLISAYLSCVPILFLIISPGKLIAKGEAFVKTDSTSDSITSVVGITTGHDTVRIGQVISIKLKTDKPLSAFTTLFIEGLKVKGLTRMDTSRSEPIVYFIIDDKVRNIVRKFFGESASDKMVVPLSVSVGNEKFTTKSRYIFLEIKPKVNVAWVYVLAVVLTGVAIIALLNNILKDDNNLYYSLGRTQLFYWTILFSICYLVIWHNTGMLPDVTATALTILGISAGTTAAGKVIENQNKGDVEIDANAKSEGWFYDILSDGSSINIHRFQNIIFNIIFGVIFFQRCLATHAMPTFDSNVLVLLGISSGTYAGLKMTEPLKDQTKPLPKTADGEKAAG